MSWIENGAYTFLPMNYKPVREVQDPLIIYVASDTHTGSTGSGTGGMYALFVDMVNADMPHAVLDLGDAIEGRITSLYPEDTDELAARAQLNDWFAEWDRIDPSTPKDIALGNRDIEASYPLKEPDYVEKLGYDERPYIGGSQMQRSFVVSSNDVSALIIVISAYSYDLSLTSNWVKNELRNSTEDVAIVISHTIGYYQTVRNMVADNHIKVPVLYLHGHNHGPDTMTRDAWGHEIKKVSCPTYLSTNQFRGSGVSFMLELHKGGFPRVPVEDFPETYKLGGYHRIKRLDLATSAIGDAIFDFETRTDDS